MQHAEGRATRSSGQATGQATSGNRAPLSALIASSFSLELHGGVPVNKVEPGPRGTTEPGKSRDFYKIL